MHVKSKASEAIHMFEKQQRKFRRSARFISVLSKYGFQDLLGRLNIKTEAQREGAAAQLSAYERVRLALEELGPTFVKLGQSFSDRDDLLPLEFIEQLQQLQDNVETLDLDVHAILKEEFGDQIDAEFTEIDTQPIAAASIAQVYKAKLKDGTAVILKIKRPGIDAVIQDDLLILKDLISLVDTYSDFAEQLNLKHAILAFEKSLTEELSLLNEKKNIQKFRENFAESTETYVPKVYEAFCSDRVLTMEFVEGIKITDVDAMRANGIDPVLISEIGYRLFVSQILDYGFFHADPHAGNMLVTKQQQLVFIDFGAVGKISELDKPLFENLILGFMAKKTNKIIRTLKQLALYYRIPDERRFEMDVLDILNYVHHSSLKDISVAEVMNKMKDVLKGNRLVMPDYFYLLFKGVSLMDGVGRKLNPDLDVVKSMKPYTRKIFLRKLNPENLSKKSIDRATDLIDHIEEIPKELRSILSKLDENRFAVRTEFKDYHKLEQLMKSSIINLIIGFVLAANIISTAIFWLKGSVVLVVVALSISLLLIGILFIRVLRR